MLAPWPHHSSDASKCFITSVTGDRNGQTDAVRNRRSRQPGMPCLLETGGSRSTRRSAKCRWILTEK